MNGRQRALSPGEYVFLSIRPDWRRRERPLTGAALTALNPQVVRHGEDSGNLPRRYVRELAVALAADDAFERQMAAVDDDVNRRIRPHRVAVQARRPEDGAVRPPTDRVVEGRQR